LKQEIPSKDVFCNSPWYELHIYWDGSYGYCCGQTPHRPYDDALKTYYNVKTMSVAEWYNSTPICDDRLRMKSLHRMNRCYVCWHQEKYSDGSRRLRANQKSVIFDKQVFSESFLQSPNFDTFMYSFNNSGKTKHLPIDLHIDLGNHCNLACKFCKPEASSTIASQYKKWGLLKNNIVNDWTTDDAVWQSFLEQIIAIPEIMNIHLMGGETLISKRFQELVDKLIQHNRYDIAFSFVTNGMVFDEVLLHKLVRFKRVGIEVSVETLTKHNEYIRQGTENKIILKNIKKYIALCNNSSITVTIRPAINLLSIGYYHTLLRYCMQNKLIIKSSPVINPSYMDVKIIPHITKVQYKNEYYKLKTEVAKLTDNTTDNYNHSDPNNYMNIIKLEIDKCINLLNQSEIKHNEFPNLIAMMNKWDTIYNLNAMELYPEFNEILTQYEYAS